MSVMIWCDRDGAGHITGLYMVQQYPGQPQVDSAAPEVSAYNASLPTPAGVLQMAKDVATVKAQIAAIQAVPVVATGLAAQISGT